MIHRGTNTRPLRNPQLDILRKLSRTPNLTFNALWNNDGPSNTFAYHLKKTITLNLIKKQANRYQLTPLGEEAINDLHQGTLPLATFTAAVLHKGKILLTKNKDNHWQLPSLPLERSHYITEHARKHIKEKTGLDCEFKVQGVYCTKIFHDRKLRDQHHNYILKATNPKGKLINRGNNKWMNAEETQRLAPFAQPFLHLALNDTFSYLEKDTQLN